MQEVVGYQRYTGHDANLSEEAAHDPEPPSIVRRNVRGNDLATVR